jgi:hypothetical protein
MLLKRFAGLSLLLLCGLTLLPRMGVGQDETPVRRGRKYKSPPTTSHLEVLVTKKANGKPISNAAVVFNPSKDGRDEGSLEVKTDPEGKATIDVIPTGSLVRIQIIANGYATFAEDYLLTDESKQIAVTMLRPQEQISAYEENHGKASGRKAGVQEPIKPVTPGVPSKKPSAATPNPAATPTTPTTPAISPTPQPQQ